MNITLQQIQEYGQYSLKLDVLSKPMFEAIQCENFLCPLVEWLCFNSGSKANGYWDTKILGQLPIPNHYKPLLPSGKLTQLWKIEIQYDTINLAQNQGHGDPIIRSSDQPWTQETVIDQPVVSCCFGVKTSHPHSIRRLRNIHIKISCHVLLLLKTKNMEQNAV